MKFKWIPVVALVFLPSLIPNGASALWAEPSCDPAADPSSCNIAAPINVSNATQTKAGGFTLNGPLTSNGSAVFAGSVTINGTGSLAVFADATFGQTTFQGSAVFNGTSTVTVNGTANFANRFNFTGNAFNFNLTADSIDDTEVSNVLTASKFALPGVAGTDAVDLGSSEVAGFLPTSKVIDAWVDNDGDTMTGNLRLNVTGTTNGVTIANVDPADTGILLSVATSTTNSVVSAASFRSTGTSTVTVNVNNAAAGGTALSAVGAGTSSVGLQGVGTYAGVKGGSTLGYGVYGSGAEGGYFTTGNGIGVHGTVGTGFTPSTTSIAIRGEGTTGYGGYFTSTGGSSIALYVENLENTAGSFKSTNGKKAIYAESAGTGNAVEIRANDEATVGLKITPADNGVSLDVGDGIIRAGSIYGGHVYNHERSLNKIFNASTGLDTYSTLDSTDNPAALLFDGSQLWVLEETRFTAGNAEIVRYDPRTGARIQKQTTALSGQVADELVIDRNTLYAFSSENDSYYTLNTLTNTGGTASLGTGVATHSAAIYGSYIYVGTNNSIVRRNIVTGVNSTVVSGTGTILDMEVVGSSIYAVDNNSNLVRVINTASGTQIATVAVGTTPRGAEYDGQYVWVANTGSNNITRIDPTTRVIKNFDVGNGIGTGPRDLVSAGATIWIAYTNGYYSDFDVMTGGTSIVQRPTNVSTMYHIEYDGQAVWMGSGYSTTLNASLFRKSIGIDYGNRVPNIQKGILLQSGTSIYCVYMNGATLTANTTTANCL